MNPPFLTALLCIIGLAVPARTTAETNASRPDPKAIEAITETIKNLAEDPTVRTATVGFYLAPLDKPDQPLLKHYARQSSITASTMKTLTTGTVLEILGPDFQFETKLHHVPATGDLIIEGAGDPSLGRPRWDTLFNNWTLALRAAGITEIPGRIIADESAWEDQEIPGGWTWLDMGNYYAPPLTPLSFHDNSFRLYFNLTGKPGDPAGFYDADPWPADLEILDQVKIGKPGTGDHAYLYGGPGTRRYAVRGTIAADAGRNFIRGALPDPAQFCVREFTDWLNARQIPVHGKPATTRQATAEGKAAPVPAKGKILIATHRSRPLKELIIPINYRSLNLDCECLLRTLGQGKSLAGLRAIHRHLAEKNLPLEGYDQADGSGLSRTNMITPELLARANAAILTGPYGDHFLDSLPEITLPRDDPSNIDPATDSAPRIPAILHGKSGSIERVTAWTGLVTPVTGPRYIFAILINNYDGPYHQAVGPRLDELFENLSRL